MMYRYAKYKSCDVSEMERIGSFPDAGTVSPFAEDALKWCTAAGIISGDGANVNAAGKYEQGGMCDDHQPLYKKYRVAVA
ncbi:MAG: S-layer homology domain-containing protein [Lachnoclostridium sp.]